MKKVIEIIKSSDELYKKVKAKKKKKKRKEIKQQDYGWKYWKCIELRKIIFFLASIKCLKSLKKHWKNSVEEIVLMA